MLSSGIASAEWAGPQAGVLGPDYGPLYREIALQGAKGWADE